MPCNAHNCALLGDSLRAARLSSTALSKSPARSAELIVSIWLSRACESAKAGQANKKIARASCRRVAISRIGKPRVTPGIGYCIRDVDDSKRLTLRASRAIHSVGEKTLAQNLPGGGRLSRQAPPESENRSDLR